MDYQLYLFDFDYTLANSEEGILNCFYGVLRPNGFHNIEEEAIKLTIGMHLKHAFAVLTGVTDEEELERFCEEFFVVANIEMTRGTTLYPEVEPLLAALKSAGKNTGIVSTKRRCRIDETIEKFRLNTLVDLVIGVEDVENFKPDPEGINKALSYFNVTKPQTLFVGDSVIDAEAAKNAGVDFVGVTTGTTPKTALNKYPNIKIIDRLDKLLI